MNTLLAVDDGLVNGNLNFADILFLVATVLFVIAAVMSVPTRAAGSPVAGRAYVWVVGFIALACTTLAWFVL